jgi:hypothetical protein
MPLLLLVFWGQFFLGCTGPSHYIEEHEIQNLKVVFLDRQSLRQEWKKRTGQQGIRFLPKLTSGIPTIKTIKGFYDFSTDTLYCPKWDFEVCGHELHHAVLGHFHPSD